ncbi:kinesin-like protein KIF15 isoform X2 [Athalia rosae]|uniref:kinesin-like protein KIF15 isoform X2 n=1 Tax=Athalia rosae TaxID=37344 RepID=UPI0020333891|nr:kinesin-like protein KIF15 isoform X2 [Athalia rosae]
MEGTNEQLQTKYQKIATEYSKIRAQANVLKKAVIDEQTRNSNLQEQLKEKAVQTRRAEQELDSLTFRNQQLTKRVTVLQEELDEVQNRGKKNRSKSSEKKYAPFPLPVPNHILDEEFQKKIMENAQLVSQLSDKETEIISLNERIDHLQFKLDQCERSKVDSESKHRAAYAKLEKERNDIQRKLSEKKFAPSYEENLSGQQNGDKESLHGVLGQIPNDCETEDSDSGYGVHRIHQPDSKPSTTPSPQRLLQQCHEPRGSEKSVSQEESNEEFEINRVFELEKELSFWKAEYNVLKIKYDQLKEIEKTNPSQIENSNTETVEITNMLGRLRSPFAVPEEIEARESKIREYYKLQIDKLISEKHVYHIRNSAIVADTQIMSIHLETSESKRRQCEEALQELRMSFAALHEDQEVQEGNYKAQLSTISEHLANMNDKLISQTEEIQQLKFELGNKNAKRGKQK